jgi:hypothetical protein
VNLALAAQSGFGKSAKTQEVVEKNAPDYDHVVVLDFKDEYRGLVKADIMKWWITGPKEMRWQKSQWSAFIENNKKVVLARHNALNEADWREVAATVIAAARDLGDVLIVIDEAHFVAPQSGATPPAVKGLATTGRGEGASSIWVTQRLAEMEETVLAQCQSRLLGGFESSADLDKVARIVEYPEKLHNPQAGKVPNSPEELQPLDDSGTKAKGGLVQALRKFEDNNGNTVGSEWIYSDNTGERRRMDTRGMFDDMQSEHYGAQGKKIEV